MENGCPWRRRSLLYSVSERVCAKTTKHVHMFLTISLFLSWLLQAFRVLLNLILFQNYFLCAVLHIAETNKLSRQAFAKDQCLWGMSWSSQCSCHSVLWIRWRKMLRCFISGSGFTSSSGWRSPSWRLFLHTSLSFTNRLVWRVVQQRRTSPLYCSQEFSVMSPCPEPHSTNSISPLEWEGVSRDRLARTPSTFSWSSMMSLRRSAIISRRKSKEPGGPYRRKENGASEERWWKYRSFQREQTTSFFHFILRLSALNRMNIGSGFLLPSNIPDFEESV